MKTRTFKLNKLVRDKIVEFNVARGAIVNHKILSGKKLNNALITKLIEEAQELMGSELSADELADLKEVVDQLAENLGIAEKELKELQAKKNSKNGAFKKGHFIEHISLPANDKWVEYYASDPERFPEVE